MAFTAMSRHIGNMLITREALIIPRHTAARYSLLITVDGDYERIYVRLSELLETRTAAAVTRPEVFKKSRVAAGRLKSNRPKEKKSRRAPLRTNGKRCNYQISELKNRAVIYFY